MAKYLVETYYTCNIKVSHYLDDISENNLRNLEKQEDGKFEILDMKLHGEKFAELSGTQIKVLAGKGHMLPLTQPEACSTFIRSMMDETST